MRRKIISGIYCIENVINNKKYIGQSKNILDRWYKHKHELNLNSHDNDYLQKSWNKYGEEHFRFYIIEQCEEDKLDELEVYYINIYNTLSRDNGYNLKSGGQNGNSVLSEESRIKLSNSLKNTYNNNLSLKETRRINALKQWNNPEIKIKICGKNNGMFGKTHTDDSKAKISEAQKGRISHKRNLTPIRCVELDKTYDCVAIIEKETGFQSGTILQVCRGQRHTAYGYHWEFIME